MLNLRPRGQVSRIVTGTKKVVEDLLDTLKEHKNILLWQRIFLKDVVN